MVINKLIILSSLLLLVSCSGIAIYPKKTLSIVSPDNTQKASFSYMLLDTVEEKTRGLSGKNQLSTNEGALFVLSETDNAFWMKDMNFPLDIIFFDAKHKLTTILWNIPPCGKNDVCLTYRVPTKAKYALELNAGTVDSFKLTAGDMLSLQ